MTLTPADFRRTLATATLDDLLHSQPRMEHKVDETFQGKVYAVRGWLDPERLGAFGSQQLVATMDARHPGLLAHLNGQPATEITEREIEGILAIPLATTAEMAKTIADLIRERYAYTPDFLDL